MSKDINCVVLNGRLTRDLGSSEYDVSYTNSGLAVGRLSIAVNRSVKKNEQWTDEASFFDVTFYGKSVENLKPYLLKGKQISVRGELKQERWEKDGKKQSKVIIVASDVQLLGNKNDSENNRQPQNNKQVFTPKQNNAPTQQNIGYEDNFPNDIPF